MNIKKYLPELTDDSLYKFNFPLANITWFKVGGKAEVLFRPSNIEQLQYFLEKLDPAIPIFTIGAGSNLIVRDGGINGVVIQLGKGFNYIKKLDDVTICCGARTLDTNIATNSIQAQISGFEFLTGIPGTMGAAVFMNAGCYNQEISDILLSTQAINRQGKIINFYNKDLNFSYRKNGLDDDNIIFTEITIKGTKNNNPQEIKHKINEIHNKRIISQPTGTNTGGSTFCNPPNNSVWKLIDAVGGRGMTEGDAQCSEKHCNFLINRGNATALDLERLGEKIRQKVKEKFNIDLQWEIQKIGNFLPNQEL